MTSINLGFKIAAAVNILGILLFSLGFTNHQLFALSPVVASRFGLICIMLWGFAYLSVANTYQCVPALIAVFAVEKLVYVITWLFWMQEFSHDLPRIYSESPLTATFYVIYGPNDFLFCLFFAYVAIKFRQAHALTASHGARESVRLIDQPATRSPDNERV